MGKECKFCEDFTELKKMENHFLECALSKNWVYLHEYTVAVVAHSWYRHMGRKHAGRVVRFRREGVGYDLNYCPECGKRLEEYEGLKDGKKEKV